MWKFARGFQGYTESFFFRIFSLLSDKKDRKVTGSETDLFLGYYKL